MGALWGASATWGISAQVRPLSRGLRQVLTSGQLGETAGDERRRVHGRQGPALALSCVCVCKRVWT